MIESPIADSKYCAVYRVPIDRTDDPHLWEHVKRSLIQIYTGDIFLKILDEGLYHVMKFDFYKAEVNDQTFREVEYRLICKHSLARVQNIVIPKFPDVELAVRSMEKQGFKKACRYCGNVLILSGRGACNACEYCRAFPRKALPSQSLQLSF